MWVYMVKIINDEFDGRDRFRAVQWRLRADSLGHQNLCSLPYSSHTYIRVLYVHFLPYIYITDILQLDAENTINIDTR